MSDKIFKLYKDITSCLFTGIVTAVVFVSFMEDVSIRDLILTILNK